MAGLYWAGQQHQVPDGADIDEIYQNLVIEMQYRGWAGVQHQEDVHGYKPGIDLFAAVVFLNIGGQNFWGVIAVGGDAPADQAQQEIQQLQAIVASLFVTL
jgi:hypothetical protein